MAAILIALIRKGKVRNVIELDNLAGSHISHVCKQACELASDEKSQVHFEFNGVDMTVEPGEEPSVVETRWSETMDANHKAYIASPEYKKQEEERLAEKHRRETASLKESAKTETEMRDAESPWPYTKEQLIEYIDSLVDREHDYGTCVYAMSLAATAAFNYVAHKLGTTGFQSSCADLDFVRRTRHIKGPFIVLNGENMLYPQYDLRQKLSEAMNEWTPWAAEEARKKLEEDARAHPDVIAHWKMLAGK